MIKTLEVMEGVVWFDGVVVFGPIFHSEVEANNCETFIIENYLTTPSSGCIALVQWVEKWRDTRLTGD